MKHNTVLAAPSLGLVVILHPAQALCGGATVRQISEI